MAFTDDFLVQNGLKPGSTIIMTNNSYMKDEAWVEIMVDLKKGYCELPYAKENPDWLMCEPIDGFGSHGNFLAAYQMRCNTDIISMKEELHTSHTNQGYDQIFAKQDKK